MRVAGLIATGEEDVVRWHWVKAAWGQGQKKARADSAHWHGVNDVSWLSQDPGAVHLARVIVRSGVLDERNLMPGDVCVIDRTRDTLDALGPDDLVIAAVNYLEAMGKPRWVFVARQFVHPYLLITNSRGENRIPIHLASRSVRLCGVVTKVFRQ